MLNFEDTRMCLITGLRKYLDCIVIRANQNKEPPPFPYMTYSIITLMNENKGTYGQWDDGKLRKPFIQTYSFSALSDDYSQSVSIANKARTWLDCVGKTYLNDHNIIVQSVGSVTDRSNLLTVDYMYKYGFDCFLWLYDEVENQIDSIGTIDSVEFNTT